MRIHSIVCIGVAFLLCTTVWAGDIGVEGCGNVPAIAQALAKIEKSPMNDLSLEKVQSMWPTKLTASDCTTKGCRSLVHEGRIVEGSCQCCEKVDIDRIADSRSGVEGSLVVTIYYSAGDEKAVIAAAKTLAKAAGLDDDEIVTVGRKSEQSFHWKGSPEAEVFMISTKLTHSDKLWTVYIHVERNLLGKDIR